MSKKISVIVPVYNAEKTLKELIARVVSVIEEQYIYEIILVNDHSLDSSLQLIETMIEANKCIYGVNLKQNQGQQRATFIGMTHATGDYIVLIDDDLENNPEDIPLLIEEIEKGYEVVYAINKSNCSKSNLRTLGSKLRDMIFRMLTSIPKNIKVCSFRILTKELNEEIIKSKVKLIYISMEILKRTSNIGNIKVKYNSNIDSNYSVSSLIRLYVMIIINYTWLSRFYNKEHEKTQYEMVGEKLCEE